MTVSGLSGISPVAVIPYVYYDLIGFLTGFLWLFVEPEKYIAFLKKKEE
jgi:hypothetical protein